MTKDDQSVPLRVAIAHALSDCGIEVLNHPQRLVAHVVDVGVIDREMLVFERNCDRELMEIYCWATRRRTPEAIGVAAQRATSLLSEQRMLLPDIAERIAWEIAFAVAMYLGVDAPVQVRDVVHHDGRDPNSSEWDDGDYCQAYPYMEVDPTPTARPMRSGGRRQRPLFCLQRPNDSASEPSTAIDDVRFVVVAPYQFRLGEYESLDVVMHEDGWEESVQQIVAEHGDDARTVDGGWSQTKRGTCVRVDLTSPELGVLGSERRVWQGRYVRFGFVVDVPAELARPRIALRANVFFDDVPATSLSLVMPCRAARSGTDVARSTIVPNRLDIHSAFVSYASSDRSRVATIIQGMRAIRPDLDVFFDVEALRCGEDWRGALTREIDLKDVLFLCWSRAARESQWVEYEWRYALKSKGIDCIEPVAIETPSVCPPPNELSQKHFNDMLLYVINSCGHALSRLRSGECYPLQEGKAMRVGRGQDCDIQLSGNACIGRRHLLLRCDGASVVVVDLGSANGTFVDGQKLAPHMETRIAFGQRFSLGGEDFEVVSKYQ